MPPTPPELLGRLHGGRVLDVATGSGNFIRFLQEGLADYVEIIGIDINERASVAFAETFKDQPSIRFERVDALNITYPDASFDTVCISNSLHHFDDPFRVLRQMRRVLKSGGAFIIAEMYCDEQKPTQQSHVLLHHWWAAVDRANGVVHHETYRRDELIQMMGGQGLADVALTDLRDLDGDPHAPAIANELAPVFERYTRLAEGHPQLQARGAELYQRVKEIGFHSATTLLMIGKKP